MYQIAITPVPVWLFGLFLTASLVFAAMVFRRPVPFGWVIAAILLVQFGAAFAALSFTAEYSISSQACLTGIFGSMGTMLLLMGMIGTGFAFAVAKRGVFLRALAFYSPVVIAIAMAEAVILMVLMRSAALCSV